MEDDRARGLVRFRAQQLETGGEACWTSVPRAALAHCRPKDAKDRHCTKPIGCGLPTGRARSTRRAGTYARMPVCKPRLRPHLSSLPHYRHVHAPLSTWTT